MQQWSQCPRCNAQNYSSQQYCWQCGQQLLGGDQQQSFVNQQFYSCPKCGQSVQFGTPFCAYCHTPFNWSSQQHQYDNEQSRQIVKTSRKSLWLFGTLAIVLLIMFGGFIAFATGIIPQGMQQANVAQKATATEQQPNQDGVSSMRKDSFSLNIKLEGSGNVKPDTGRYKNGTSVVLVASGNPGWEFDYWGDDAAGNNKSISITMNSDKNVTAYFKKVQNILTVSINPPNAGKVVEGNQDIGSNTYKPGASTTLYAKSNADYVFDRWSGDISGNTTSINIIMDSDKNIIANFKIDTIAHLNQRTRFIVTRPGIQNIGDIPADPADKRFTVALDKSEVQFIQTAFQADGFEIAAIQSIEAELPTILENGIARAVIFTSEHPSILLQNMINSNKVSILPFSQNAIQAVISKFPEARATTLPPNTYTGQTQAITGYALP